MQPGQDPLSFTSRKSAATHLPPFELPAPPFKAPPIKALQSKYQQPGDPDRDFKDYPSGASGSVASAGNLLTPPNTLLGEGASPNPQHVSNNSSADPNSSFPAPAGYWPNSQSSAPQYGPYNSAASPQWIPPRGMYSPTSMDTILRHNTSEGEIMATHQYEMHHLPPFGSSMSIPASSTLPAMAAYQHQQNLNNAALMHAQQQIPNNAAHVSPVNSQDPFARPPPNPAYFPASQSSPTNPQVAFAPYSGPHHNPASPISPTNTSQHRMSPPGSTEQIHTSMSSPNPHSPVQFQRQYGQYPLPAMTGPVMSNIQNSGGQMALVGGLPNYLMAGFNSGHAANMQQMYGATHAPQQQQQQQQQPPATDRPFKCDQCVQSFNRNHDLKRHKRIHLAVKPFPCGHCDKSFSRKDALKRHILVKGCDKSKHSGDSPPRNAKDSSSSLSPVAKIETTNTLHLSGVSPPQ